jgi:hypothetical protein
VAEAEKQAKKNRRPPDTFIVYIDENEKTDYETVKALIDRNISPNSNASDIELCGDPLLDPHVRRWAEENCMATVDRTSDRIIVITQPIKVHQPPHIERMMMMKRRMSNSVHNPWMCE